MTAGRRPPTQTTTTSIDEQSSSDNAARRGRPRSVLSAYDRLIQLLSRRDHSERELRTKLSRAEHSEEEISAAIEVAQTRKWLPDEAVLATREAGRLARIGKSPQQIRSWLSKKGLPTAGLAAELAENETESAYKTAAKVWSKQLRMAQRQLEKDSKKTARRSTYNEDGSDADGCSMQLEYLVRNRVQRLLISRGFSSTTARAVYARLLRENPLKIGE
jgi:SOS response regulatory protein OraA/RecX